MYLMGKQLISNNLHLASILKIPYGISENFCLNSGICQVFPLGMGTSTRLVVGEIIIQVKFYYSHTFAVLFLATTVEAKEAIGRDRQETVWHHIISYLCKRRLL